MIPVVSQTMSRTSEQFYVRDPFEATSITLPQNQARRGRFEELTVHGAAVIKAGPSRIRRLSPIPEVEI